MRGTAAICLIFLLLLFSSLLSSTVELPNNQTYWNVDGDFSLASLSSYSVHATNVQVANAPWGNRSWNTAAFAIYPNRTKVSVDEYSINVTGGYGHVWVHEDRRLVSPRTGVVDFVEDSIAGFKPPIPVLGRDTILAYEIMRQNTNISAVWPSPDSDGVLFDLFAQSQYDVNGSVFKSNLVIDFYVHQECGPLNGLCAYTNDTTLTNGLSNNHIIIGRTHFFEWRIHSNLAEKVWVSDVVNLRWYLEASQRMAFCHDATGSDNCSSPIPQANLTGLTATAETFGGSSGFAIHYEYLLQPNDCGTGMDAGDDFNHPLRTDDLSALSFREVDGWLGTGNLYQDTDDYYEFNVSNNLLGTNSHLLAYFHGADSISLYAPGNPPILRTSLYNQSLSLWYNFSSTDPAGYWYLQVHRSSGFGFYSFDIWLGSDGAYGSTPATCSLVAPTPAVETSWQLIAVFAVVTVLIVVSGRIWGRRKPADA